MSKRRVPYCTECEYLFPCSGGSYTVNHCKYNEEEYKTLGVDNPPKRSPMWCPKRQLKQI